MRHIDLTHLPGHTVVVDPPRVAVHRNSDRQAHLEERRRVHFESRVEGHPLPTPRRSLELRLPAAPEHNYTKHPLAERAARDGGAARAPARRGRPARFCFRLWRGFQDGGLLAPCRGAAPGGHWRCSGRSLRHGPALLRESAVAPLLQALCAALETFKERRAPVSGCVAAVLLVAHPQQVCAHLCANPSFGIMLLRTPSSRILGVKSSIFCTRTGHSLCTIQVWHQYYEGYVT
jgi:hypothetical protein